MNTHHYRSAHTEPSYLRQMSRVRSACTAGSQLAFCTVALTALLPTHTLASATTFHPCINTLRRVERLEGFIDVFY